MSKPLSTYGFFRAFGKSGDYEDRKKLQRKYLEDTASGRNLKANDREDRLLSALTYGATGALSAGILSPKGVKGVGAVLGGYAGAIGGALLPARAPGNVSSYSPGFKERPEYWWDTQGKTPKQRQEEAAWILESPERIQEHYNLLEKDLPLKKKASAENSMSSQPYHEHLFIRDFAKEQDPARRKALYRKHLQSTARGETADRQQKAATRSMAAVGGLGLGALHLAHGNKPGMAAVGAGAGALIGGLTGRWLGKQTARGNRAGAERQLRDPEDFKRNLDVLEHHIAPKKKEASEMISDNMMAGFMSEMDAIEKAAGRYSAASTAGIAALGTAGGLVVGGKAGHGRGRRQGRQEGFQHGARQGYMAGAKRGFTAGQVATIQRLRAMQAAKKSKTKK